MLGHIMLDACAHHRRPPVHWPGFVKGCPVQALQRSLRRTNRVSAALCCAATHGTHIKTTHASDLGHACVGKPKNLANRVPVRYGRGTNSGALNASLFGALLQSAAQEASHQLQGTLDQVNKLTKGFQPRPEGYPPGL